MHDPRTRLELLPDGNLFDLARNPAAAHRKLVIQLLWSGVARSPVGMRSTPEAAQYVLGNPIVLNKIDPASAALATAKLPNIIDCHAHEKTQRVELARVVNEHNTTHSQHIAALEATVSDNKAAGDLAVREAYATLWRYFAKQQ